MKLALKVILESVFGFKIANKKKIVYSVPNVIKIKVNFPI